MSIFCFNNISDRTCPFTMQFLWFTPGFSIVYAPHSIGWQFSPGSIMSFLIPIKFVLSLSLANASIRVSFFVLSSALSGLIWNLLVSLKIGIAFQAFPPLLLI